MIRSGKFKSEELELVDIDALDQQQLLDAEKALEHVLAVTGADRARENLQRVRKRLQAMQWS